MGESAYDRYRRILSDPSSGFGIDPRSRLGSGLSRVAEEIPFLKAADQEARRFRLPFNAPGPYGLASGVGELVGRAASKYLLDPQEPAATTSPDPTVTAPTKAPAPDFDSVPGQDIGPGGLPNYLRRQATPMGEFAPGVKFRDSGPTSGDAEAIEGLRRSSGASLRPLLSVTGDNGGPLSAADMENNQAAMDTLDNYFTNAPQEQRVQELAGKAAESRASMLADDPFAVERGQAEIEAGRLMGLEGFKSKLQQGRELERRKSASEEYQRIQKHAGEAQDRIDSMPPGPEKEAAQLKLDTNLQAALKQADVTFGLGAGISSSTVYDRTP